MGVWKFTTTYLPLAQLSFDYKLKNGSKHAGTGTDGEHCAAVKTLLELQPVNTRISTASEHPYSSENNAEVQPVKIQRTEKTPLQVQTVNTCNIVSLKYIVD